MIYNGKLKEIPRDELLFIDPGSRVKFFKHLLSEYKKRYPQFHLELAYLNQDSKLPMDYLLLFKCQEFQSGIQLALVDYPTVFSKRSLPGYRYCLRADTTLTLDDYFTDSTHAFTEMLWGKFEEFICSHPEFSTDPKRMDYWKRKENIKHFADELMKLTIYSRTSIG